MDDAPDVRNPDNICRLCLSTEEPVSSVFAEDQVSAVVSLASKIQASLSIEIQSSDKLPTLICVNCLTRVNEWHAFKEACLLSQEKLQRSFGERIETIPSIKTEPMDVEEPLVMETVPLTSDDEWEDLPDLPVNSAVPAVFSEDPRSLELRDASAIKKELLEDETNNANAENDSVCSRELLLNPMAVASGTTDDRMESEASDKAYKQLQSQASKKKGRRGPTTHYRGTRRYKKRCAFCQIYLHSKYSYAKHMERFHSGPMDKRTRSRLAASEKAPVVQQNGGKTGEPEEEEVEEMVEDVEEELLSLEKDAPLTPVQQNIISQLKTFSCYSCQENFTDRRSTLNHIRQHMPDLRPYTCIACLTEFADRSIYKLHCGASFQCAMKIALVIPEHGTEKYFTCNMCLRPMANRKELLSHLSKHSDKQYEQLLAGPYRSPPKLKPITPLPTSPGSHRAGKSNSTLNPPPTQATNSRITKGPYKNGDPAHNHPCIYCGMIYRYKQNMYKHVELCKKLPEEDRVSYRCVRCGMTFLALKRFVSHLNVEHRTKDLACSSCNSVFQETDLYLEHCRQHRTAYSGSPSRNEQQQVANKSRSGSQQLRSSSPLNSNSKTSAGFSCALCPGSFFPSRNLLAEHRKSHLKMKIYSCSVCRRMFGRASALEAHMADHELVASSKELELANSSIPLAQNEQPSHQLNASINSDPGANSTECHTCGKVFANYPNLRRHIRTVHDAIGRYSCFTCSTTFKSEELWAKHVETEHKHQDASISCPLCPDQFETSRELESHRETVHGVNGEDHLACYICGKRFANESSLRIHRGHHSRVNSRLSIGNREKSGQALAQQKRRTEGSLGQASLGSAVNNVVTVDQKPVVRSPRARKSFPNKPTNQVAQHQQTTDNFLQCQVCDDRFQDVTSLRKHLWDVHCARNKPEKAFTTNKLECELCTNVLPDEESLASHMKWHQSNPILSNGASRDTRVAPVECDLCGKFYSSRNNLYKHKKRHKATAKVQQPVVTKKNFGSGFTCNVCRKVFAMRSTLKKHKAAAHPQNHPQSTNTGSKKVQASVSREGQESLIKPVRPKLDFDTILDEAHFEVMERTSSPGDKPVTCTLCRRIVPSMRALYKHRQIVHKIFVGRAGLKPEVELQASIASQRSSESGVGATTNATSRHPCSACPKFFSNRANMRQHFRKFHANAANKLPDFRCSVEGCKQLFKTAVAKQNHERTHVNVMYVCGLCPKHMLSRNAMADHMLTAHKTSPHSTNSKLTLCKKISLDNYTVKGATDGRQCPLCKVYYPNFKSMKIHYLKVHEGAT